MEIASPLSLDALPSEGSLTVIPTKPSPSKKSKPIFYRHCAGIRRTEMASPFSNGALPSENSHL